MSASNPDDTSAHAGDVVPSHVDAVGSVLTLDGVPNTRDVGGLPTTTGGRVRPGLVFRGSNPGTGSSDDRATLQGLGLHTVLDLRSSTEAALTPSVTFAGSRLLHLPVVDSLADQDWGHELALADFYDYVLRERGGQLAAAVDALAQPEALPALVHCTAGKDRTGLVIALSLSMLGVPDAVVVANFAASEGLLGEAFHARMQAAVDSAPGGQNVGLASAALASPPEMIVKALAQVRAEAGTVTDWLLAHGMDPATPDRLRELLVEP